MCETFIYKDIGRERCDTMNALFAIISVVIVSLVSFVGLFTLSMKLQHIQKILLYIVSFSAGTLLGAAFFHLIPELGESVDPQQVSIFILAGVLVFFVLEKFIHWHHCHDPKHVGHTHPVGALILMGDALHNFVDGLAIGAAYIVSTQLGITTTIAIIVHEIPQEVSDFAILLHAGYSRSKALFLNFLSALTAVLGAIAAFVLTGIGDHVEMIILPIMAGGFIYIAASDLLPRLQKETAVRKSAIQFVMIALGLGVMWMLLLLD